jgi:hypothetical protein
LIREFDTERRESGHGEGTYLGAGALSGDAVETLRSEPHYQHDVELRGNVLFVPRASMNDAAALVEVATGVDYCGAHTKFLTSVLAEHGVGGVHYDAVVFHFDRPRGSAGSTAEAIVLRPGPDRMNITRVVQVDAHAKRTEIR